MRRVNGDLADGIAGRVNNAAPLRASIFPMLLIHGAYGYTGELVARRAVGQGVAVELAGRNQQPLQRVAAQCNAPYRVFGIDDADAIRASIAGL